MKLSELFRYIEDHFIDLNPGAINRQPQSMRELHDFLFRGRQTKSQARASGDEFTKTWDSRILLRRYLGMLHDSIDTRSVFGPAQHQIAGKSHALMTDTITALAERGFTDFEYLGSGMQALVIKGRKENGSTAALRFSQDRVVRVPSIAMLPASEERILFSSHQIEILPVAYKRHPAPGKRVTDHAEHLWGQRMIYVLALLHGEGKYCFSPLEDSEGREDGLVGDVHPGNIVGWNKSYWICDPNNVEARNDARTLNVNAIRYCMWEVTSVREAITAERISATENYATVYGYGTETAAKIRAWGVRHGVHTVQIPKQYNVKNIMIVVDLNKERDGRRLAIDLRAALGPRFSSERKATL